MNFFLFGNPLLHSWRQQTAKLNSIIRQTWVRWVCLAAMNLFSRNPHVWSCSFTLFLFATCAPAQVTVRIGQNFTGSTYGVNSSALPPDPNGAIGPKYFVEFINGTVAVHNQTNGLSVQRKSNPRECSSTAKKRPNPKYSFGPSSGSWQ
jgi:hypothetical protein